MSRYLTLHSKLVLLGITLILTSACSASRSSTSKPYQDAQQTPEVSTPSAPNAEDGIRIFQAHIYEALAEYSAALAANDSLSARLALDDALDGIRYLSELPDGMDSPESRELYRSVITATDLLFAASDTTLHVYRDIFALRASIFETLNKLEAPLAPITSAPPSTFRSAVPLDHNRLVERSIAYLKREPNRHINLWLNRAHRFFPLIEPILAEEKVPDELKYLAMIESGLNPRAHSRAGAAGLWQFISSTGRAYGLSRNYWVDERLDPVESTRAAARHLRDLYRQFGDWHLALAAYNCGPTCVSRALRRHKSEPGKKPTFWDIYSYLPRETRNYVPLYIATVLLATNPESNGLQATSPAPPFAFDTISASSPWHLDELARHFDLPKSTLRDLNPQLIRLHVPAGAAAFPLRVPPGSKLRMSRLLASLPAASAPKSSAYKVRKGDSLSKIAQRYGTSIRQLKDWNGLSGSVIYAGQTLYLPPNALPRTAPSPPSQSATYRVQRGDNLTTIARKHAISVQDLRRWNGLSGSVIYAGQNLIVSGSASRPQGSGSGKLYHHVVQRGETLSGIALQYNVKLASLMRWNGLRNSRIRAGQKLAVQLNGNSKVWKAHVVRRGETLGSIASRFGISISAIKKWNALRSNRIYAGQRLALFLPASVISS